LATVSTNKMQKCINTAVTNPANSLIFVITNKKA
jgi:hypothetical protein